MAKKEKTVAPSKELDTKAKPNGERHRPFPWVEPFPVSELDKDGVETVFVRATLGTDLIINGVKLSPGQHTLEAGFAHAHSTNLSAPK